MSRQEADDSPDRITWINLANEAARLWAIATQNAHQFGLPDPSKLAAQRSAMLASRLQHLAEIVDELSAYTEDRVAEEDMDKEEETRKEDVRVATDWVAWHNGTSGGLRAMRFRQLVDKDEFNVLTVAEKVQLIRENRVEGLQDPSDTRAVLWKARKGVEDMANKPTPQTDPLLQLITPNSTLRHGSPRDLQTRGNDKEKARESEANARLVAAAPEMLGMLHLAFEVIRALWREEPWEEGEIPQVMDEIQELIAKVTKE